MRWVTVKSCQPGVCFWGHFHLRLDKLCQRHQKQELAGYCGNGLGALQVLDRGSCSYKTHQEPFLCRLRLNNLFIGIFPQQRQGLGETRAQGLAFVCWELGVLALSGLIKRVLKGEDSTVYRKMERKLTDGHKDSKLTRRKEKCCSLTQGCQLLWTKQLCRQSLSLALLPCAQRRRTGQSSGKL